MSADPKLERVEPELKPQETAPGQPVGAEPAPEPDAPEPHESGPHEPQHDVATCALCGSEVDRSSTSELNHRTACAQCVANVRRELAEQVPRGLPIIIAGAGGLVGALLGAAVWAAVAAATDMEVGYVAVLVGFLAGLGVKRGAGKQRGPVLQYMAVGLAVVGLLAAKYMVFAYAVVKLGHEKGVDVGYFSQLILSHFPEALGEMLGAFDVLFVFLAVGAAYRVPKANSVLIVKN